ncbi:lipoprotein [Streptomyces cacaoi]|uniref:Lipoprotein n=1 Tax=Streptomyces cacaoi TaxID=1898 RepID=A0A4Y3QXJ1_STRCI|nr:lipoprotein [Streptomyces cacaoi]
MIIEPDISPHARPATGRLRRTRRRTAVGAGIVLVTLLGSGCEPPGDGDGKDGASGRGGGAGAVSPFDNERGTGRGLAPVTSSAEQGRARELIDTLDERGRGPRTGYARERYGYAWMDTADGVPLAHNGCDTRNDLLKRDGSRLRFRSGSDCVVVSMTLHDPYTGKDIDWKKERATEVQIDHVVPLSYSWQMGAARWPESKRKQLANDPLNLLPVEGRANGAKSDSGPASWLPPDRTIRCAYAVRFAQVALKYELPVTGADKRMMTRQCGG